jgi:hypothetical protein
MTEPSNPDFTLPTPDEICEIVLLVLDHLRAPFPDEERWSYTEEIFRPVARALKLPEDALKTSVINPATRQDTCLEDEIRGGIDWLVARQYMTEDRTTGILGLTSDGRRWAKEILIRKEEEGDAEILLRIEA